MATPRRNATPWRRHAVSSWQELGKPHHEVVVDGGAWKRRDAVVFVRSRRGMGVVERNTTKWTMQERHRMKSLLGRKLLPCKSSLYRTFLASNDQPSCVRMGHLQKSCSKMESIHATVLRRNSCFQDAFHRGRKRLLPRIITYETKRGHWCDAIKHEVALHTYNSGLCAPKMTVRDESTMHAINHSS